jgi:hypothetical protein
VRLRPLTGSVIGEWDDALTAAPRVLLDSRGIARTGIASAKDEILTITFAIQGFAVVTEITNINSVLPLGYTSGGVGVILSTVDDLPHCSILSLVANGNGN